MSQIVEDDFRAWVVSHRDRLRQTAYLLSGDWFLADDLVQEALGRSFSVWHRVCSRGNPEPYVRKVLLNVFLDHRRRPARREGAWTLPPEAPSHQDLDGAAVERDRVLRGLAAVPVGQRAVLVLRFWEDLSIEQTATALGRSTGHVKSQTHRGLRSLRKALDDEHPDPADNQQSEAP